MPIGPEEASKSSDLIRRQVEALQNIVDARLLNIGDKFVLHQGDYEGAGVHRLTDRFIQNLRDSLGKTYTALGWREVKIWVVEDVVISFHFIRKEAGDS